MFALTIMQRDTREAGDRVDELLAELGPPFRRGQGDEAIGVVACPEEAVTAALTALRLGRWSVGIGIGPEIDDDAAAPARGYAREAVNRAMKPGESVPLAVSGPHAGPAAEAEAVLRLAGLVIMGRSEAEWRVVDLLVPGARGQQKFIADSLGISAQAVSKAIQRSHWAEEQAVSPAAARLLRLAAEDQPPRA